MRHFVPPQLFAIEEFRFHSSVARKETYAGNLLAFAISPPKIAVEYFILVVVIVIIKSNGTVNRFISLIFDLTKTKKEFLWKIFS